MRNQQRKVISVSGRCRITQPRLRSYQERSRSNARSVMKLNNFHMLLIGVSLQEPRLHSIGVKGE